MVAEQLHHFRFQKPEKIFEASFLNPTSFVTTAAAEPERLHRVAPTNIRKGGENLPVAYMQVTTITTETFSAENKEGFCRLPLKDRNMHTWRRTTGCYVAVVRN